MNSDLSEKKLSEIVQKEKPTWDLFISHASEDKEALVNPLVDSLSSYGVNVLYDEFELKAGDSLSHSIDKGLIESKYGLVILSSDFFSKQWTDYELRSLLAKNINGEQAIIPIWHKINKEAVQNYSLYLTDIKALSTDLPTETLVREIIKVVRPDILNSHMLKSLFQDRTKEMTADDIKQIPREKITASPVMHTSLPKYMIIACRLIEEVFHDINPDIGYIEMLENFSRDWDYDVEFIIWSAMANAYMAFIREMKCDFNNIEKKKEVFYLLLDYSMKSSKKLEVKKYQHLSIDEQVYLIESYINNSNLIWDMVKEWN